MRPDWGELGARARGLGTRLLGAGSLRELAAVSDLPTLAAELQRRGWWPREEDRPVVPDLDRALRRREDALLDLLRRRAHDRLSALSPLWAEDELRTLRVLVRGAAAGAPPEQRRARLRPVPGLADDVLAEAARADGASGVARALDDADHPAGGDLRSALEGRAGADLFRLEAALARGTLRRALGASGRGQTEMRAFVGDAVDRTNAWTLVLAPGWHGEIEPDALFVEGGRLDGASFRALAAEEDPDRRRRGLGEALADGPLAAPLGDPAIPVSGLELAVLRSRARAADARALGSPLSAAPVIAFRLRLRAETSELRRVVWGIALGAPAGRREAPPAGPA